MIGGIPIDSIHQTIMEMDGRDKADMQRTLGTREIVEELDRLRLTFGFDTVKVLTPFVESKLRDGQIPQRNLKVFVAINEENLSFAKGLSLAIEMTFLMGFPAIAVTTEVVFKNGSDVGDDILDNFKLRVKNYTEKPTKAGGFPKPVEILIVSIIEARGLDVHFQPKEEVVEESAEGTEDTTEAAAQVAAPTTLAASVFTQPMNEFDSSSVFCCKICSTELFDATMLNEHSAPENAKFSCSSYFLEEAPEWLDLNKVESDKMYCKKCSTRVGSWSWAGGRCGCKAWVAPAFQVIKSKVDPKQRKL